MEKCISCDIDMEVIDFGQVLPEGNAAFYGGVQAVICPQCGRIEWIEKALTHMASPE